MKQILLTTLLLFVTILLFGQTEKLTIVQLRQGSMLSGCIINKSFNGFTIKSNLNDTLQIKNRSVKRQYIVEETFDERGDVPILVRGRYYTAYVGMGGGRQRINPQNNPNAFFFPGSPTIIPVTRYTPLILTVVRGSAGYQFNRYFGIGFGTTISYNSVRAPDDIFPFGQIGLRLTPYFEGKFNYPLKKYGNKDLWINVSTLQHIEVMAGVSFLFPKRRLNVGVGFFKGFDDFRADSYLSIQCGMQL